MWNISFTGVLAPSVAEDEKIAPYEADDIVNDEF